MRALVALLLATALTLTGCGGDGSTQSETPVPNTLSGSATAAPTAAPTATPTAAPTADGGGPANGDPPPADEGSGKYPALEIGEVPGELLRASNATDADETGGTLIVTLKAGQRLGSRSACEGESTMTVTATPDSNASARFGCGASRPQEFVAEDSAPAKVDTTYAVTITVPKPARWAVVLYAKPG